MLRAEAFGGAGLGLSITRALVEILGGEITASSHPGAGRLFRVELTDAAPCYFEDAAAALAAFQSRGGHCLSELPIA